MQNELIKGGKRAQIGELRTFGGRQYIKTVDGWKFHGKGTGTKTKQHIESVKQHSSNHTNEQSSSAKQDVKDKQKSSKQSKSADDTNRRVKHLYDVQKMFSSPENRHMNNVPDNQKKNFIDGLVRSQGGSKKDVEDIYNHLKSTGKYDEYKNKVNSTLTDDEKKTIKHFVDNGQSNVLDEVAIKNIMKKGVSKQAIDSYIDSLKKDTKKTSSNKDNSKNESKPKQNKSSKVEPLVGEAQKKIVMEYYNYEPNRLGYILSNLISGRDGKEKQQIRKELSSILPSHIIDKYFGIGYSSVKNVDEELYRYWNTQTNQYDIFSKDMVGVHFNLSDKLKDFENKTLSFYKKNNKNVEQAKQDYSFVKERVEWVFNYNVKIASKYGTLDKCKKYFCKILPQLLSAASQYLESRGYGEKGTKLKSNFNKVVKQSFDEVSNIASKSNN